MLIASDALMAGKVRMIRLETAVGPFVPGLTEKREKVPHPGLQHVLSASPAVARARRAFNHLHLLVSSGSANNSHCFCRELLLLWPLPRISQ